jgi:protein gp37
MGCDNCYAETLSIRYGGQIWGKDNPRKATKGVWKDFLKWQAVAAHAGEVHRVFVGSMMDIFEKPFPLVDWNDNPAIDASDGSPIGTDVLRNRFFTEIVPACPNLMFLLLTKRPSNINKMIPEAWKVTPPQNVMFGTSPVNPQTFNTLVAQLKKVKGKRFLSVEPQLAPILPTIEQLNGIDWVIQGGESGAKRRLFNTDWARVMRDICAEANTPYFFKQIDKIQPIPDDLQIREYPEK